MSNEPNSKRRKMDSYHKKQMYRNQKNQKILEPGIKGFMATCNFREKDCVRECYNLLNEYVDVDEEKTSPPTAVKEDPVVKESSDDEEDIATQLENEIKNATATSKTNRSRFQQVETKTPNCVFIKSTVENPIELGVRIVRDIAKTKKRKTRMLLRFLPVEVVCKATLDDIKNSGGKLFDKYFLNTEPTTFSIVVNKRYNNNVDRMQIIQELADIVSFKNSQHKVDLKNPKTSVIVEIIKGLCCLTVLPDYNELRKYNLFELCNQKEGAESSDNVPEVKSDATNAIEKSEAVADVDENETEKNTDAEHQGDEKNAADADSTWTIFM